MAEKNIAALLREDAKTIRVTFVLSRHEQARVEADSSLRQETLYNYVTHLDVAPGDLVLVQAAGQYKAASVMSVDAEVQIPPNAEYELRWVIMKLDMAEHEANTARNQEIESLVADAYRANLRRSFANQILSGLEGESKDGLLKLLGK